MDELTTRIVKEGTKDFKEYFNIEFVPVQYLKWNSTGNNSEEILYNLKDTYDTFVDEKMEGQQNISHIIGFTKDANDDGRGISFGGLQKKGEPAGKIAHKGDYGMCIIPDREENYTINYLIKHELSHTYSLKDKDIQSDNEYSVMSYHNDTIYPDGLDGLNPNDWSISELQELNQNVLDYPNREIKEVAEISENLSFAKTGNLFFAQAKEILYSSY